MPVRWQPGLRAALERFLLDDLYLWSHGPRRQEAHLCVCGDWQPTSIGQKRAALITHRNAVSSVE